MEKLIVYENGLKLIVDYIPSMRSVAAGIWVGVGSANEVTDNNGISHFIEHMIFKGTDKMTAFEIANAFEYLGASINAFTSKECTCYYFKSIGENSEKCFSLLSDIFFDSQFDKDELDKERKVILEEINMVEDSSEDICYDLLSEALYGTHSLGQTILGPTGNIKAFNKTDVKNYMDKHYCADNIVISLAGNITLKDADKLVKKYVLPKACKTAVNKKTLENCPVLPNHKQRIKDFEQSNIAISYPSLKFNDEKTMVQAVLNTVLGGAMSSRLFQRIREELGLAYSIYSSPSSYTNNGSFNIVVNISAENLNLTIDAVKDELKKLLNSGIDDNELQRAKTQLKSSCIFSQENVQSIMISNGKLLTVGNDVYDIDKKINEIDSVTKNDVTELSEQIFKSDKACTVYVGKSHDVDFKDIMKL